MRAGPHSVDRLWQRNYYEHVIRDEADWDHARRYIEANPMNWDQDAENTIAGDDESPSRKELV